MPAHPFRRSCRLRIALVPTLMVASAALSTAQFRRSGVTEGPGVPARYPPPDFEDGAFTVCKIQYTSVRFEAMGVGWATDYPYAGINLMIRLGELTRTPVSVEASGEPNYWVVRPTDEALYRCPFTIASDVGIHRARARERGLPRAPDRKSVV